MGSLLEFEGKNVASAVEAARKALNVPQGEIEFFYIDYHISLNKESTLLCILKEISKKSFPKQSGVPIGVFWWSHRPLSFR